eukprot:TRINITY_DN3071_c0_g2_i1.p1 TRINITY_DN3071_c0_g2~~TRINITY_DN3071_c0_g2_i1.p1  ORF type:complete len:309 (+),score=62.42 TRINITY_DN3071_c0_g2_i1:69-929(+)
MAGLLLYVQLHGQVIPVEVDPDASVKQLMERVSEATGSEPPLLRFQGAELDPADLISDTGISQEAMLEAVLGRLFQYDHDFDENGLFYYLGTLGLEEPWRNPARRQLVECRKSRPWGRPASDFVGRKGNYCRTDNATRPYFQVDLSKVGTMSPTHYTLRHGRYDASYILQAWELFGSTNGEDWTLLDKQEDCPALKGEGSQAQGTSPYFTGTFKLSGAAPAKAFTHFRVVGIHNFSPEEDEDMFLHLSGIELYGTAMLVAQWEDLAVPGACDSSDERENTGTSTES